MKDPKRDEPLVGLEYVVEVRFKGRREPSYECQLCCFTTELAPLIQHLIGQRHRKSYLMKHHAEKAKRTANDGQEDKVRFLKRIAKEVEEAEGLKMYKRERYERPSTSSSRAKAGFKPENDPVRRQKALEYMENFEITSDSEAALVINIAQSLSEALTAFCGRKAAIAHIRSLPPLMSPVRRDARQHTPHKPFEGNKDEPGDKNWNPGHVSNGLVQLHSLLQQTPSTSLNPTTSYGGQIRERMSSSGVKMRERASSYGVSSQDLATMSALQSSFAHQSACGINEWMQQFNQSASTYFQPTPAVEIPSKMADSGIRSWDMRASQPVIPATYLPVRGYQATPPSQGLSSWYPEGSGNVNLLSGPSFSSESNHPGWSQQSLYQLANLANLRNDAKSYPVFSGSNSHSAYQHLNNAMGGNSGGLTADIMSQLRGKDIVTLTSMLQQLVPHYPDLQKVDLHALAQALNAMN
ncbi:uncharacterized protein LOC128332090 isoform X2 [Hemicordylus capensis]|nr:uncharacterized protein LOC128332090 isoform X2 [Hemicordylus capensis]